MRTFDIRNIKTVLLGAIVYKKKNTKKNISKSTDWATKIADEKNKTFRLSSDLSVLIQDTER